MSVHTDAKNATHKSVVFFFKRLGFVFFGFTHRVKNYPTNEIGAFAHVSGAAEVTVKHNLGASNTKQSCRAHIRNDEEDIRQVASTPPGRNKKTKKMQGKINVELLVLLVSEHKELNNVFIAGDAGAGATGA